MKKKYMNRTIMKIALIGYAALLILLLTLNILMLRGNYTDSQNRIIGLIQETADEIEERLSAADSFLYNIYADNGNFRLLPSAVSEIDRYSNMYELNKTFSLYQMTHDSFDGYFIMNGKNENVLYKADGMSAETIGKAKELISNTVGSGHSAEQYYFCTEDGCCYALIIYHQKNISIAGICNLGAYRDILESTLADSARIFLWFEDNYDESSQTIGKYLDTAKISPDTVSFAKKDGKDNLYGIKIKERGIWLIGQTSRTIFTSLSLLQIFLFLITLASVAGTICLYRALIKRLVKPMYRLMDVMEGIQNNSISKIPEMNLPFYEMNLMSITLKNMVEEIRNQRIHYYEEKLSRQEAQLQFMQLQLKPHFFLNCLKSLNTMAADAGMENMQEIILNISDYLRYFLRIDRKTTLLREEIIFVENYIKLQNLLANRKIICNFLMEEDLSHWEVPVLCIQTFVENSIKYVKLPQGKTELPILIQINRLITENGKEFLNLIVSDTGQGYPQGLLSDLNKRYFYGTNSIGINNIKQRCDILYGERAEYSFYNMGGAVSELFLPASPERSKEDITENENLIGR